jgi:Holliday junction resolvase
MSRKRETRRQKKTQDLLREHVGGYWRKIWGGPFQQGGIPDILGCCEGLFFGFEIKEPDGETSQLQDDDIEEIIEAGGCAAVIVEPMDAVKLVQRVIRRSKARS